MKKLIIILNYIFVFAGVLLLWFLLTYDFSPASVTAGTAAALTLAFITNVRSDDSTRLKRLILSVPFILMVLSRYVMNSFVVFYSVLFKKTEETENHFLLKYETELNSRLGRALLAAAVNTETKSVFSHFSGNSLFIMTSEKNLEKQITDKYEKKLIGLLR